MRCPVIYNIYQHQEKCHIILWEPLKGLETKLRILHEKMKAVGQLEAVKQVLLSQIHSDVP